MRFTRKHEAIRALVLFTYGMWYGTLINLQFIIADHVLCYPVAGYVVGEPVRQRRSEFLVALAWLAGSGVIFAAVLHSAPLLVFVVGMFDRLIRRTAYIALVDDVVGMLSRPDVRTVRGRAALMLVQAFAITSLVWGLLGMLTRWAEARAGKAI